MEQKKQQRRTLALFCVSTIMILGIIAMVFWSDTKKGQRDHITLPEQVQTTRTEQKITEAEQLHVTKDNVQQVVSSMLRPDAYRQSFDIRIYADHEVMENSVELWVNGSWMRMIYSSAFEVRNILTDGETVYVWFDDDRTVKQLPWQENMTADELLGIPTYEDLESYDADQMLNGLFLTEENNVPVRQIYASAMRSGVCYEYWIGLDSGLLYQYRKLEDGQPLYELEQTAYESLASSDEAFSSVFVLPNGRTPFQS